MEEIVCSNCSKLVSAQNILTHEAYCARVMQRCGRCHETIRKTDYYKHVNEAHRLQEFAFGSSRSERETNKGGTRQGLKGLADYSNQNELRLIDSNGSVINNQDITGRRTGQNAPGWLVNGRPGKLESCSSFHDRTIKGLSQDRSPFPGMDSYPPKEMSRESNEWSIGKSHGLKLSKPRPLQEDLSKEEYGIEHSRKKILVGPKISNRPLHPNTRCPM